MRELQPWKRLSTRELLSLPPRLRILSDKIRLPDGRIVDDFYRVVMLDFACVFAQTPDGSILLERHYKHGVGRIDLSVPGGYLEPNEEPLQGAKRELEEETGYQADGWHLMGSYVVNGNQGCGKAHLFFATGARKVNDIHNDDLEETEVLLMKPKEVIQAAIKGEIATLTSMTAIALALNKEFVTS
jgi:ADP-ribose pyrophosphatase